jgi:phage tail sheath protein FI
MPRKFDFISPGIILNEVDESVLPAVTKDEGPLLIGRALTGPAMKPVRVSNLEDLYAIFGYPVSGKGALNSDVWRDGNLVAPTYAMFAAQAHLASNSTPVTFMRLIGEEKDGATGGGQAGWELSGVDSSAASTNNSAYGLFIAPRGGDHAIATTGKLCAVFYTNGVALGLSGSIDEDESAGEGAAELYISSNSEYKLAIHDGSATTHVSFNFDPASQKYIRNAFNTNPQKLNSTSNFDSTSTDATLFLGETYELAFEDCVHSDGGSVACIVPLVGTTKANAWHARKTSSKQGSTGWFVNRTVSGAKAQLFKLHAHSAGEYMCANYWVQIEDLKMGTAINPNSSFTVKIMKNGTAVETYTGCNLNPSSNSYISKKIGDQYQTWDETEKKYNVRGMYPNKSDYFYVEVDAAIENQTIEDSYALPLGFKLPAVPADINNIVVGTLKGGLAATDMFLGGDNVGFTEATAILLEHMHADRDVSFKFPTVKLTTSGSNSSSHYTANSVFGLRHISNTGTQWDASYADVVRANPTSGVFTSTETFHLEAIKEDATTGLYYYESGSSDFKDSLTGSTGLFGLGIRKFAAPVVGGFDGVDIFNTDPFAPSHVGGSSLTSYERHSIDLALDIASDAEVTEYDLLAMPGQTNSGVVNRMISICETRGDALAIVDLEKIYLNAWENGEGGTGVADFPTVTDAVDHAQERSINSSYAATYYPSVRMVDSAAGNNDVIIVPPSVAAIGAIAKSQAISDPWFAPAGFNRGGINELGGIQGPRVIGTVEHLSKANRDALYEENINPIARFPASGDIVIFGQKTLQQLPSALDRINVRRLLLYIKRRIGKISETILFDNNVQSTWNRFKSQADKVLSDVQSRLGIVEYKLILDETTTTADLVDRNILYAKVLIKPARAIEFIVVDFVVTRSGIEL